MSTSATAPAIAKIFGEGDHETTLENVVPAALRPLLPVLQMQFLGSGADLTEMAKNVLVISMAADASYVLIKFHDVLPDGKVARTAKGSLKINLPS